MINLKKIRRGYYPIRTFRSADMHSTTSAIALLLASSATTVSAFLPSGCPRTSKWVPMSSMADGWEKLNSYAFISTALTAAGEEASGAVRGDDTKTAQTLATRRSALATGAALLGTVVTPFASSASEFMMPSGMENLRYPDGSSISGEKAEPAPPPAPPQANDATERSNSIKDESNDETVAAPSPEPVAAPSPEPVAAPAFQIDMSTVKNVPVSTSKMGGLLEPFADVNKGWRILKPYGWNQFDTLPGSYEEKWTDIVAANQQNLFVTTVPVKSTTTSVETLGEVSKVAAKLAAKRGSQVVDALVYKKEGILFYQFEFKSESIHQLLVFCVAKGKLWSIDASAPEARWTKVEELYQKSILSFMPKL